MGLILVSFHYLMQVDEILKLRSMGFVLNIMNQWEFSVSMLLYVNSTSMRTYVELIFEPGRFLVAEAGVMVTRVFQGTVRLSQSPLPGTGFAGDRVRTVLSAAQLGAVRNALAQGGAFAPGPSVLFLRSDTLLLDGRALFGQPVHLPCV